MPLIIDATHMEPDPLPIALQVLQWEILMQGLEDSKQSELNPNGVIYWRGHKIIIIDSLPHGSLP